MHITALGAKLFSPAFSRGLPADLGLHQASRLTPIVPQVRGVLVKNNWVIRNNADPNKFNHFIVNLYHPQKRDLRKPVIILLPGMLCNGNLFRVTSDGTSYRSLDNELSFANRLAYLGYTVTIIHPRFCRWVYNRYAKDKLGINNRFNKLVSFNDLILDLKFYLDACLFLSGAAKAVLAGFSMGGMEICNYLAFEQIDPRIAALLFLATPVEFAENREPLIAFLHYYGLLAKYLPFKDAHPLNLLSKNINTLRHFVKLAANHLPQEVVQIVCDSIPVISQVFNSDGSDIKTQMEIFAYVLETMPRPVIQDLLFFASSGKLKHPDTGENSLDKLKQKQLPPTLIVSGTQDRICPPFNVQILDTAVQSPLKEVHLVKDAGHVDLVTSSKMNEVIAVFNDFLGKIN